MKWASYAVVVAAAMGILSSGGSIKVRNNPKLPCTFVFDPDTGEIIMIGDCGIGTTASTGTTNTTTGTTATSTGTTSTGGTTSSSGTTATTGATTSTTSTSGTTSTTGIGISSGGDSGGSGGGTTGGPDPDPDPEPSPDPSVLLSSFDAPKALTGTKNELSFDVSVSAPQGMTAEVTQVKLLVNQEAGILLKPSNAGNGGWSIRLDSSRFQDSLSTGSPKVKFVLKLGVKITRPSGTTYSVEMATDPKLVPVFNRIYSWGTYEDSSGNKSESFILSCQALADHAISAMNRTAWSMNSVVTGPTTEQTLPNILAAMRKSSVVVGSSHGVLNEILTSHFIEGGLTKSVTGTTPGIGIIENRI